MASLASFVEVKVVRPVEHVQPIKDVLAGMRMYDVEKHCDPEGVSNVY